MPKPSGTMLTFSFLIHFAHFVGQQRGCYPPRLRFPLRAVRLCPGLRRRRGDVYWAVPRNGPQDGRQGGGSFPGHQCRYGRRWLDTRRSRFRDSQHMNTCWNVFLLKVFLVYVVYSIIGDSVPPVCLLWWWLTPPPPSTFHPGIALPAFALAFTLRALILSLLWEMNIFRTFSSL